MYMRARSIPVNPQTARQIILRNAVAMFSQQWFSVLTQVQRDAWDVYGASVSLINRLGDSFFASGQNHYIRANVSRLQANNQLALSPGLAEVSDAPTVFMLPTIGSVPVSFSSAGTGTAAVVFDDTQAWVNDADNALLIYEGRPRSASRKFFKGPYRLLGVIRGDATTPPTSPTNISNVDSAYPVTAGQVVKARACLSVGAAGDQPTGLSGQFLSESVVV